MPVCNFGRMLEFDRIAVGTYEGEPDGKLERVAFACENECLLNGEPVETGFVLLGDLFGIDSVGGPGRNCECNANKDVPNQISH